MDYKNHLIIIKKDNYSKIKPKSFNTLHSLLAISTTITIKSKAINCSLDLSGILIILYS